MNKACAGCFDQTDRIDDTDNEVNDVNPFISQIPAKLSKTNLSSAPTPTAELTGPDGNLLNDHQLNISCGCHGDGAPIQYWNKVAEFTGYFIALSWLWWTESRDATPSHLPSTHEM